MYTVDMLNMGLKRQVLHDWWESHWSAQDTNKHIRRTHAHTGYTHWARAQIPIDLLPPLLKPAYRHPDCVRCGPFSGAGWRERTGGQPFGRSLHRVLDRFGEKSETLS